METMSTETISTQAAHMEWANRPKDECYQTLEELQAAVDGRRKSSYEVTVELAGITVLAPEKAGERYATGTTEERYASLLVGNGRAGDEAMVPSNWAFGQLAGTVGAPPRYLRTLSPELVALNLNYSIAKAAAARPENAKEVKLLSRDGNGFPLMASTTSPGYGRIWDADVVEATRDIVKKTSDVFHLPKLWSGANGGAYASDHDVFMFLVDGGSLVDGGGERDQLHRGFFVWNSEVGDATLGIQTFLFRAVCGNLSIWEPEQVKALRIRHTARAPERFVADAIPALEKYAAESSDVFQKTVLAAKAFQTPKERDEAIKFLTTLGFTRGEATRGVAAAEREEGGFDNLWLLHNGLTATARDMAWVDSRIELDRRAGKLLEMAERKLIAA